MSTRLDHLVVAARTLAEGVAWCEATLGIAPGPGGRHAVMGTCNRLFSIASSKFAQAYFEIIAIDPEAPPPTRVRWFGLDGLDLTAGPRLVHWVARVGQLDAALARLCRSGIDAGRAIAAERATAGGLLRWRIAVRDDGRTLARGALPTLIEWSGVHPTEAMPASGVTLQSLRLGGLDRQALQALDLQGVDCDLQGAALTAMLDTPRGPITLTSRED